MRATSACVTVAACVFLVSAIPVRAQSVASRGFAEARVFFYPQTAGNDVSRAVGEAHVRYEPSWKARSWLRLNGGFDGRIDTHEQVERRLFIDWQDRTTQRPPLSVRRLSALFVRGGLNVEIGKQFIRWGKADVLNPTDRFAPRDFLSVVDNDFLAVAGARVIYESGGNTFDVVWVPHFTPSRIPLFNQRWAVAAVPIGLPGSGIAASEPVQAGGTAFPIVDAGSRFPVGSQQGLRWNRTGAGYEFSLSFYNGFNHLPLIDAAVLPAPLRVALTRVYPQMRMYGGDFAVPNRWVTVKGELGYFTSTTAAADEYGIYVLQLERQHGDWVFVGGYAGDFVTRTALGATPPALALAPATGLVPFAAERGLARAFLGRATRSLDINSSVAFQAAVRRNGDGTWLQGQYERAWGSHVRATFEGNLIRGATTDFLGQYRRNSNATLSLRYSF